ncbi:hypothetical protein QFZ58_000909 [Streptomyces sp. B1I3]|nr:hypothetical protein [Streptomyces sp. B1I3]
MWPKTGAAMPVPGQGDVPVELPLRAPGTAQYRRVPPRAVSNGPRFTRAPAVRWDHAFLLPRGTAAGRFGVTPRRRHRPGTAAGSVGTASRGDDGVAGVAQPGRIHFWLSAARQVHRWSLVPSAEDTPAASRHLPDWGFLRVPSACGTHFWAAVLLQP